MRSKVQFWLAFAVCTFGCGLLLASLIIRPTGTIDASVLTAFGEVEAVGLALFGIDRIPSHGNAQSPSIPS